MNQDQIESAIEHAINALALAKLALSKSALPVFNDSDVLRKLAEPKANTGTVALGILDDAERRITALESAAVAEAAERARQAANR
jgi:hypothetical protein